MEETPVMVKTFTDAKKCSCDMLPVEAIACAAELEKFLLERGIWFTTSKVNEPELRYIKIEASIKVKA